MYVQGCNVETSPCPDGQGFVFDSTQIELLLNGGWNQDAFNLAFMGVLSLWVTGLTVGIIIAQVRKARAPT
jgi:hypothetical protein